MDKKIYYQILSGDDYITIEGYPLTAHFACRSEKGRGYRVTHLPSGLLLTEVGFSSLKLAKTFAELIEDVFRKTLDRNDIRVLLDASETNPTYNLYHELIQALNNQPKKTISDTDLNTIVEQIINGQPIGAHS